MNSLSKFIFMLVYFLNASFYAQETIVYGKENEHARAICSNRKIVFVGTNLGNVYRIKKNKSELISTDTYPEIRDIQFTNGKLYVMQTGDYGRMLCFKKTTKRSYVLSSIQSFEMKGQNVFLDGFCISKNKGLLMGDPIDGKFSLYSFCASGEWKILPAVASKTGEAAFAASGSTVQIIGNNWYFVSGGLKTRLFHSTNEGLTWNIEEVPFSSCESCGAYSLGVIQNTQAKKDLIVLLGGDYKFPEESMNTSFFRDYYQSNWTESTNSPAGYRSVVIYNSKSRLLFCGGTNGIDFSSDDGKTWNFLSKEKCYSMIPSGRGIIFSSDKGKIIRIKELKLNTNYHQKSVN